MVRARRHSSACLFFLLCIGHLLPPAFHEQWVIIIMLILIKLEMTLDHCRLSDTTVSFINQVQMDWRAVMINRKKKSVSTRNEQKDHLDSRIVIPKAREKQGYKQEFSYVTDANELSCLDGRCVIFGSWYVRLEFWRLWTSSLWFLWLVGCWIVFWLGTWVRTMISVI